jgi:hypothetical protein
MTAIAGSTGSWPCWGGAFGNGSDGTTGPRVARFSGAKKLWESEAKIQQGWHSPGDAIKRNGISMGYASPAESSWTNGTHPRTRKARRRNG